MQETPESRPKYRVTPPSLSATVSPRFRDGSTILAQAVAQNRKTNGTQNEGLSSVRLHTPRVYTPLLLRRRSTRLLVGESRRIKYTIKSFGYVSNIRDRTHLEWKHPLHRVGRMGFSGIRVDMRDCPPEIHNTTRCGAAWLVELVQLKPLKDKVPARPMRMRSSLVGYAIGAVCDGRTWVNP